MPSENHEESPSSYPSCFSNFVIFYPTILSCQYMAHVALCMKALCLGMNRTPYGSPLQVESNALTASLLPLPASRASSENVAASQASNQDSPTLHQHRAPPKHYLFDRFSTSIQRHLHLDLPRPSHLHALFNLIRRRFARSSAFQRQICRQRARRRTSACVLTDLRFNHPRPDFHNVGVLA